MTSIPADIICLYQRKLCIVAVHVCLALADGKQGGLLFSKPNVLYVGCSRTSSSLSTQFYNKGSEFCIKQLF